VLKINSLLKSILANDYSKIVLLTLLISFILFPVSDSINFYQNDDWIYYKAISQFLIGNYEVPRYIEALFYTQGFLGTVYAAFFGLEKLPVLTFIFSMMTFFIFQIIVRMFYIKSFIESTIFSLFLFVSPLFIYSSLGFMSDIYFLFFLIIGVFFYEIFNRTGKWYFFFLFNLFMIIGFFTRQLSIVSGIAFALILFIQKKYKLAIFQMLSNITLLLSYFYLIPKTSTMEREGELYYFNLLNFDHTFSITYAGLVYSIAFIAPLTILLVSKVLNIYAANLKFKILFLLSIILVFFSFNFLFNPEITSNKNMYYFKNTLDRNGFFFGSLLGNKYHFFYSDQIYFYFELISKITLSVFITGVLFLLRNSLNFYSLFSIIYLGFMVVLPGGVYDRYYLVMIPITILFILNLSTNFNKITKLVSVISLFVIAIYTYNFAMDFVLVHNYIWKSARNIVNIRNVNPKTISAGNAWNRTYQNEKLDYRYIFSFEPREVNPKIKCCYEIYFKYEVNYPLNFFEKPVVYFYRKIN